MTTTDSTRDAYIAGLRALADFLEAEPGVPVSANDTLNVFTDKAGVTAAARAKGGWRKEYGSAHFWLTRSFGPIAFEVNASRNSVCRKVSTGTRVIPAQPAQPERTEEVFDWICDETSLLAESAD